MLQISSLKTSFTNLKKDTSDVSDSLFTEWVQYCSDFVYNRIANSTPDKLFKTYSFVIGSGVTSVTLPTDFRDVARFGSGVYETKDGLPADPLALTGYGATDHGYYISDSSLYITDAPNQSTTYILRYIPLAPVYTSTSDYLSDDKTLTGKPIIRDEDREYIIRALDVQYSIWDEDLGMEATADARFVRILSDMLSRTRSTPGVYNVQSYNSAF